MPIQHIKRHLFNEYQWYIAVTSHIESHSEKLHWKGKFAKCGPCAATAVWIQYNERLKERACYMRIMQWESLNLWRNFDLLPLPFGRHGTLQAIDFAALRPCNASCFIREKSTTVRAGMEDTERMRVTESHRESLCFSKLLILFISFLFQETAKAAWSRPQSPPKAWSVLF